jgi:hypothetical protein
MVYAFTGMPFLHFVRMDKRFEGGEEDTVSLLHFKNHSQNF